VLASGAVALVQAAILPMAASDTSHPLGWIQTFPLSVRIKQVPVDFGLRTLYESPLVTRGLLGAVVIAAIAAALLLLGSRREERIGAGLAAAIGGCVLIVPLVLAWLGSDYYVTRNLIAAWVPLAVALGAACTAARARLPGAAFCALLVGGFLYGSIRIDQSPQYQRPDWRAVANALGSPLSGTRAIVAFDGRFAAEPLAVYLHGVPWPTRAGQIAGVSEVDLVGSAAQTTATRLPSGIRLLARRPVDSFLVTRFAVEPGWRLTPAAIGSRAASLLEPGGASPAVLIQSA
jgi:hypothetical protein